GRVMGGEHGMRARGAPPKNKNTATFSKLRHRFTASRHGIIRRILPSQGSRPVASALIGLALASSVALQAQSPKPRVHIFATGGTISNVGGDDSKRRTGTQLVDAIPALKDVADVTVEQFSNVASGSIT